MRLERLDEEGKSNMQLTGRITTKVIAAIVFIIILCLPAFIGSLKEWNFGRGDITITGVFGKSIVVGLNNGFEEAHNLIVHSDEDKSVGQTIFGLIAVVILYLFLFCIVWSITGVFFGAENIVVGARRDPLWIPAIITLIILVVGAFIVGFFAHPGISATIATNVSNITSTNITTNIVDLRV